MSPTNPELRQFITQLFNDEELETLCFDYFPEVLNDFGSGMGKNRKVIALIGHCERRDRLADLQAALERERTEAWNRTFAPQPVETPRQSVSTTVIERDPRQIFRIHKKTGIEMVRIPAGPFLYGANDNDAMAKDNEKPQRTIDLPEYLISLTPVTNTKFAEFIQATGYVTTAEQRGLGWGWTGIKWENIQDAQWRHPCGLGSSSVGNDNHPVIQVSWEDAKAYCDWAELVLPSEEQWEKAARGTDARIWPWGNDPPTSRHCNFNRNVGGTTPVGKFSPTGDCPYGCADMAGNVWEWTGSKYENDTEQIMYMLRGGSWDYNQRFVRVSVRSKRPPEFSSISRGFRVAAPVDFGC